MSELMPYPPLGRDGIVFCPKCGKLVNEVAYFRSTRAADDYLKWTCECCYSFCTETKDAK